VLNDPIQLIIGLASLVGNSRETFHKSGSDDSNPVPSSGESIELRFRAHTLQGPGRRDHDGSQDPSPANRVVR
jgi:hypothetical protein